VPYGQAPYAGVIYAGVGTAGLSVTVTPAMGLALGSYATSVPPLVLTAHPGLALGVTSSPVNTTGAVLPSFQAAGGLCVTSGAPQAVGGVITPAQAATGLLMAPGSLLGASMGLDYAVAPFIGLGLSTGPQFGVAFVVGTPAMGLVFPTTPTLQVIIVPVVTKPVGWGLGLSQPGKPVLYPDIPPVPPLTPVEEFGAWAWDDAILGTTPESEPIDLSYSDAAPASTKAKGEPLDLSFSDAHP
jgi:hypothetical protein